MSKSLTRTSTFALLRTNPLHPTRVILSEVKWPRDDREVLAGKERDGAAGGGLGPLVAGHRHLCDGPPLIGIAPTL